MIEAHRSHSIVSLIYICPDRPYISDVIMALFTVGPTNVLFTSRNETLTILYNIELLTSPLSTPGHGILFACSHLFITCPTLRDHSTSQQIIRFRSNRPFLATFFTHYWPLSLISLLEFQLILFNSYEIHYQSTLTRYSTPSTFNCPLIVSSNQQLIFHFQLSQRHGQSHNTKRTRY